MYPLLKHSRNPPLISMAIYEALAPRVRNQGQLLQQMMLMSLKSLKETLLGVRRRDQIYACFCSFVVCCLWATCSEFTPNSALLWNYSQQGFLGTICCDVDMGIQIGLVECKTSAFLTISQALLIMSQVPIATAPPIDAFRCLLHPRTCSINTDRGGGTGWCEGRPQ